MFFDYTLTILSFFVIVYAFNPAYAQTLLIPELLPAPVAIPQDANKVIKAFSSITTEEKNDNDYGIYDWDSYNANTDNKQPAKQESEPNWAKEGETAVSKPAIINNTQVVSQINDILTMQQIIAKDMFLKSISNSSSLETQLTPQQVEAYNNIFNKPINSFSNNGTKTDSTLPLPIPSLEAVAVKAPIDNQSSRTTVLEQSQQPVKQLAIEPKSVQMQDSLHTVKSSPQIKTTALEPEPESEEIRTFASDAAKAIDKDTDVKVEPRTVPAEFKPQQQEQPLASLPNPNTTNNTDNAPSKPAVAGGLVAGQANTTKQLFDIAKQKTEETSGIVERGVRDTQKWFNDTGEMLGHLGKQIQDIGLQIYNIYAAISAGIVTFLIFLVVYVINRFVKNTKRKWHIIKDWFAKDTEDIDKNGTPDTKWIPERGNRNTQAVSNYVRPHINTNHLQTNGKKRGKNPSFAKQMARNTIGDIMRNTMSKRDDYNDERFSRFMDNQEREYRNNNNNSSIRPNDSRLDRWGYSAR